MPPSCSGDPGEPATNRVICRQFPGIKWAQRKEQVFMTIELQDCENVSMDLSEEGVLTFK